ncbi:MAG: hypothetical protein P8Y94_09350, partial [Acidobacteriota bacterium]
MIAPQNKAADCLGGALEVHWAGRRCARLVGNARDFKIPDDAVDLEKLGPKLTNFTSKAFQWGAVYFLA